MVDNEVSRPRPEQHPAATTTLTSLDARQVFTVNSLGVLRGGVRHPVGGEVNREGHV